MRVLITGSSGFTGTFLTQYLAPKKNVELYGMVHTRREKRVKGIDLIPCDLRDSEKTRQVIHEVVPDAIIHLAGLTHGPLNDLLQTNVLGTDNLLRAARELRNPCRVLVIGSSAEYGYSEPSLIPESACPNPVGDYGISKVSQTVLALKYHRQSGLQVAVVRPFNLIGPGQAPSFVCGQIISQIVAIERGQREALDLREVTSRRDFIDVRDAVTAYWSLVHHKKFSTDCSGRIFNVGSGKSYSITDVLEIIGELLSRRFPVNLPDVPEKILVPDQQSDNASIMAATGWRPRIGLNESLADMLDAARKFH